VRGDEAVDLTRAYPTVSQLLNVVRPDELRTAIKGAPGRAASMTSSPTAWKAIATGRARGSSPPAISRP
jgi:hypothetical protein